MAQFKNQSTILNKMQQSISADSIDFVEHRQAFHLHTLLTEQRHPKTWNLSFVLEKDTTQGLSQLLSVDETIVETLKHLNKQTLEQAAQQIQQAILHGHKVYVYGCGATGRLAKQLESAFWRPFWRKVHQSTYAYLLPKHLQNIENQWLGEITGGDRALISSLEGLEDLPLIGALQLEDHGITKEDVVFAITEGGETSSVIGTINAAFKLHQGREHKGPLPLYFIYNNPDDKLMHLQRSRTVLQNKAITKINLTTGPQAVTGSTRMQATTIETFVMGIIMERAVELILERYFDKAALLDLGLLKYPTMAEKLGSFAKLLQAVQAMTASIALLTDTEVKTYQEGKQSVYFAHSAIVAAFTDITERSPTFRLAPLDTIDTNTKQCWSKVLTSGNNQQEAWSHMLQRPFQGLDASFYRQTIESQEGNSTVGQMALKSLRRASSNEQQYYDFSIHSQPVLEANTLTVSIYTQKDIDCLKTDPNFFKNWQTLLKQSPNTQQAAIVVASATKELQALLPETKRWLHIDVEEDAFSLRPQIALKMLLNGHSTAVMGKLGRLLGNTMAYVQPCNLKLIGRATYLIQSHLNSMLACDGWLAKEDPFQGNITYAQANALLFGTIEDTQKAKLQEAASEVSLTIIKVVQTLASNKLCSFQEALKILQNQSLGTYLERVASLKFLIKVA